MYDIAMPRKHTKTISIRKLLDANGVSEDSILFAILFLVSAFFALLFFVAGEKVSLDIDIALRASQPASKTKLELAVSDMVKGHPMEKMAPLIAQQDPVTAAFIVSIAKQESNWGTHSPKDADGRECYNYWGFRGNTENVTPSGYSCFDSPRQAVAAVGRRLSSLIYDYQLDTPRELLVWKCGSSCAGHDQGDVARWQRTVGMYSERIKEDSAL